MQIRTYDYFSNDWNGKYTYTGFSNGRVRTFSPIIGTGHIVAGFENYNILIFDVYNGVERFFDYASADADGIHQLTVHSLNRRYSFSLMTSKKYNVDLMDWFNTRLSRCGPGCGTCSNNDLTPFGCVTCKTANYVLLSDGRCVCPYGKYDNGSDCVVCNANCGDCNNFDGSGPHCRAKCAVGEFISPSTGLCTNGIPPPPPPPAPIPPTPSTSTTPGVNSVTIQKLDPNDNIFTKNEISKSFKFTPSLIDTFS